MTGTRLLYQKENQAATRFEMIQEKLTELKCRQEALGCVGCSKDCPFDLKLVYETLVKTVGEAIARRIFSAILEWDHDDPLLKTVHVSYIINKVLQLLEITKCTLRCMVCHRFKMYKNGETNRQGKGKCIEGPSTPVTKNALRNRLDLKKRRLNEQGTEGRCPGPGVVEGEYKVMDCLFREANEALLAGLNPKKFHTKCTPDQLFMLAHDYDHNDLLLKKGKVDCNWEEAQKCMVRCVPCHKFKTLLNGDSTVRHWVVLDFDGKPMKPVAEREVEGKPMKMYDMDWRLISF
jgi:hypothetical protein